MEANIIYINTAVNSGKKFKVNQIRKLGFLICFTGRIFSRDKQFMVPPKKQKHAILNERNKK